MKDSVLAAFLTFSQPIEGRVPYFYLDTKGLVTIAVGVQVHGEHHATTMPLQHASGAPAAAEEIRQAYRDVAERTDIAGNHKSFENLTPVALSPAGIDQVTWQKLTEMEEQIIQQPALAEFADWPADAQLALISVAWAQGPDFGKWPALRAACAARDWTAAAEHCHLREDQGGTIVDRNVADRAMFLTAAWVAAGDQDAEHLWYVPLGPRPVLRPGATGDDVLVLQERLSALGFLPLATDVYDSEAEHAVRDFQLANGLDPDAVVAGRTWAALGTGVPAGAVVPHL